MGGALTLSCLSLLLAQPPVDLLEQFEQDQSGAGAFAVSLARRAFEAYTLHRQRIPTPDDLPPLLRQRSGVFVSAVQGDAPRCCMGSLYPTQPTLADEIIQAAVAAAGLDSRKPPVQPGELTDLQLIVSIVAPPEAITDPHGLDPAVEGLVARGDEGTGVVLPGETPHLELAIKWAKIRAGVEPGEPVEYFRIRAYRIVEPPKNR